MGEGLAGEATGQVSSVPARARPPAQPFDLSGAGRRDLGERLVGIVLFACAAVSVLTTVGIVFILLERAIEFFAEVSIIDFLTGTQWTPLFKGQESFGVLALVSATLMIGALSMLVAIPLGLMSAIYLSEYARSGVRTVLKPFLELLAGIPTIVYGYFALTFITPEVLKPLFPETKPFNVLSASVAVGIMVLPMVASLSEDALRAVPRSLREGAYAVGATKFEVSTRVIVPAALSGIVASIILAVSRAIGETMIVAIASGSRAQVAKDPLNGAQAMTGYIVQVFSGDVVSGSVVYKSLFAVGLLLFAMTLLMNIFSQWVVTRFREVYQ
ncbi:MAG: phosphate transport system permease protein [Thermomicrobiales bacterium]|nr:phosphate transport system permease protein [Thermomicrobiales bacterium]